MVKKAKESLSDYRVLCGMTAGQYKFLSGVSTKLKVSKTEALRQIIQFARKHPDFKEHIKILKNS